MDRSLRKPLPRPILLMGGLYLAQTYSANPGLCAIPITLYLKETLGLSASQLAGFQAIVFIPWVVKL